MGKSQRDSIHDARGHAVFVLDDDLIDRHAAAVGPYGVAVYVALARFAKREGQTIMAYSILADTLGFGRTKVRATLKELEIAGLITIDPQTDDNGNPIASNRYTLLPTAHLKHDARMEEVSLHDRGVSRGDTPHAPHDRGVSRGEYIVDSISSDHESSSSSGTSKNGDDDDVFFRELRRRKIGQKKAREIMAANSDMATALASIDNLHDPTDPFSLGRLITDLIDTPPPPGRPWTRAQPKAAPAVPVAWTPPAGALSPTERAAYMQRLVNGDPDDAS